MRNILYALTLLGTDATSFFVGQQQASAIPPGLGDLPTGEIEGVGGGVKSRCPGGGEPSA